uniref:VirD4-like protein n=2 Tax=Aeromonas sp. Ne-1 TaxID=1675689 RepID=A0A0H4JD50_9GAMM|nr:VirD4-like protein [Aeromonas sp. Ne-1]
MLIIQSLSQLDSIYSKEERKVIVDNCGYKLVLNATDVDTQKYLSDMAGQTSAQIKSYSSDIKSIRVNTQEQTVPLIRPEEFGILEKPILFPYGLRPIELERSFWDEDKQMRNLVHSGNSQALAK